MLSSIRVDDWDQLIPWEQVTLVGRGSPETRLQARFHHAISARGGGWQGMFEVGDQVSTRYTSKDWTVIRVVMGGIPAVSGPPSVEEAGGHWHNGSRSNRSPVFVPPPRAVVDAPEDASPKTAAGGIVDLFRGQTTARRFVRALLPGKGRAR